MLWRFAILLFWLLSADAAFGAICSDTPGAYSVKQEYKESTYVASGRILSVTWLDDSPQRRPTKLHGHLEFKTQPGGFDPYSGANYRFQVFKSYRGKAPKFLTIFSQNNSARTPFFLGKSYLLFIGRVDVNVDVARKGDLVVDICGNSNLLENSGPVLKQLPH